MEPNCISFLPTIHLKLDKGCLKDVIEFGTNTFDSLYPYPAHILSLYYSLSSRLS